MAFARFLILPLFGSALLAACGGGGDPPPPAPAEELSVPGGKLALRKFSGPTACEDYETYVADSFTEQYLNPIRCMGFGPCPIMLGAPGAVEAPAGGDGAASPTPGRVSQTNTQEIGVDEADIVKTDAAGNLYVLSGRILTVIDAFPPAGLAERPQARLDLAAGDPNFYTSDFFLDEANARLVALGASYNATTLRAIAVIIDVTDPMAPVELARIAADGYPLEARRIGARVHRVLRFDIALPAKIYEDTDLQSKRDAYQQALSDKRDAEAASIKLAVRNAIREIVHADTAAAFLPQLSGGGADGALSCTDVARAEVQTGSGLAVLQSFNTDGTGHAASAAVNNAYLVYASAQNLYLGQHSVGWFFNEDQVHESVIYRFALSATGAPAYQGFGRVPGSPLNAYSLSEHEGHLRVASTEMRFDAASTQSLNHLSVLRATGVDLPRVGGVHDFAPGEFLRGSRFAGDRGFLVTFRQVDPLFAFDLSDPAQPRIASELKIPGFSSYLMPLGTDWLLTIGRGGDDTQLNGRMAVQLFDVRDLGNVQQVAVIEPVVGDGSYSWSAAEYDPHAFSYFSDSATAATPGTLAVPLQSWGSEGESFAGFVALRVDPAAPAPLAELGRVDHAVLAETHECAGGSTEGVPCADAVYAAEPRRALFMQDDAGTYLYTISALGLLANDAADPSIELGRALFPYDTPQCCTAGPADGGGGAVPPGSP